MDYLETFHNMLPMFKPKYKSPLTIIQLGRSIKIKYLLNHNIDPIVARLKSDPLSQVINLLPKDIVLTGSYALYVLGLIDRAPQDIDIIVSNGVHEKMINGYDFIPNRHYQRTSSATCLIDDKHLVDIFINDSPNYTIVNGIKIENPMDIVDYKIQCGRGKDHDDLLYILNKLNKNGNNK